MPNQPTELSQENYSEEAHRFVSEHVFLLGTLAYWMEAEIFKLADALYDHSQRYHEAFTEEVLSLLMAHVYQLTKQEQHELLPRFVMLSERVRSNLEARTRSRTTIVKTFQDSEYVQLFSQNIPEDSVNTQFPQEDLPFSPEQDDDRGEELNRKHIG